MCAPAGPGDNAIAEAVVDVAEYRILAGTHCKPKSSNAVLAVSHLDHTPEICDPANLKAMWQGCPLHHDRDHHKQIAAATRRAAIEAGGQLALTLAKQPPGRAASGSRAIGNNDPGP